MGCDIHFHVEVKQGDGWRYHDWREPYRQGTYEDGSTKHDYKAMFNDPLWVNRNYNLFAILADVRNGHGFAGVKTGDGFVPISSPRGLPENVTDEIKAESDGWGRDGHSHSWLMLAELQAYDWDEQIVRLVGWTDPPDSWCSGVIGGRVAHVSNEEMEELIESGDALTDDPKVGDSVTYYYTRVSWEESYRDAVGSAWFSTMEYLAELGKPEDVRVVFWFD